ncbi:hypothetical protein CVT25_011931 [Psilocybe cyanescens]|uniref:Uncharacterized protein n=1 Tax=Psilocybe cyanescens TaxID=93625 RepID=A0A409XQG6_PSICY|nr:hypothetical protein CVT25_011931 [Psilocybe cyanescens]
MISMTSISAEELSKFLLVPQNGMESQVAQVAHRLAMIDAWGGIANESRVLELGCGQGDCTVAIAHAVGKNGYVDAVDPAPPGYGSPYTVGEAHEHLSTTDLGPRINWIQADPLQVLPSTSTSPKYDIAILAHCLWYFSSVSVIHETFRRLDTHCKQIYVAEWALSSSHPAAEPHVLSALTQASLECRKPESQSNVRTVVSPAAIKKLAEEAGLKFVREGYISPKEGLLDGRWEVGSVASAGFVKEVEDIVKDERERSVIFALRDSMLRSLECVEGGRKGVRSMDVWCAVFEKA